MEDHLTAVVVATNGFPKTDPFLPEWAGAPRPDQLQGTWAERLSEIAGRVCYDSFGKGRSSKEYHHHILEVGHGSVYEHATTSFYVHQNVEDALHVFMQRPGVHLRKVASGSLAVTMNLRAMIEFGKWTTPLHRQLVKSAHLKRIAARVRATLDKITPEVSLNLPPVEGWESVTPFQTMAPATDDEKWASLLLTCSRNCSHELVRHGDFTAISQRSTRYVNESESPLVPHPLLERYPYPKWSDLNSSEFVKSGRDLYSDLCEHFEQSLTADNVPSGLVRKQARGAARVALSGALKTELMFSASVTQWKRMIAQRLSIHADAEIRVLFGKVLTALRGSDFSDRFNNVALCQAADGIGLHATLI